MRHVARARGNKGEANRPPSGVNCASHRSDTRIVVAMDQAQLLGAARRLANATVQITSSKSSGSGFHLYRTDLVITNHHVVRESDFRSANAVAATTEGGDKMTLSYIAHSDTAEHDYAIFRVTSSIPAGREALQPATEAPIERGTQVLFAGFPHGIGDLLVQHAIVAAPFESVGFYLDGSINGGNSGGPIVSATGDVLGVVTQRRFLGAPDMQRMAAEADALEDFAAKSAQRGHILIMGFDFGQLLGLIGRSNGLIKKVIEANSNAGIGIGYLIRYAAEGAKRTS